MSSSSCCSVPRLREEGRRKSFRFSFFLFFFLLDKTREGGRCSEPGTQDTGTPEVGLLLNQTPTPTSLASRVCGRPQVLHSPLGPEAKGYRNRLLSPTARLGGAAWDDFSRPVSCSRIQGALPEQPHLCSQRAGVGRLWPSRVWDARQAAKETKVYRTGSPS